MSRYTPFSTRQKGAGLVYTTRHMKQTKSESNSKLKQQLDSLIATVTTFDQRLATLETRVTSLFETIIEVNDKCNNMSDIVNEHSESITELKESNASLALDVDAMQEHWTNLQTTVNQLTTRVTDLESTNNVDTSDLESRITTVETATKDYYQGCVMYEVDGTTFCVNIPETLKRIDDAYLKKIDENCGVVLGDFDGYDWKTLPSNQSTMKTMVISDNQTVKSSQYSPHDIEQQLSIIWNQLSAIQALL